MGYMLSVRMVKDEPFFARRTAFSLHVSPLCAFTCSKVMLTVVDTVASRLCRYEMRESFFLALCGRVMELIAYMESVRMTAEVAKVAGCC